MSVQDALKHANKATELDSQESYSEAREHYLAAISILKQLISSDEQKYGSLQKHVDGYERRVAELEILIAENRGNDSNSSSSSSSAPSIQESMAAEAFGVSPDTVKNLNSAKKNATKATEKAGGMATLGGAALVGGLVGATILGGAVGLIGGAAGGAYAATRSGKVGDVARSSGQLAVDGIKQAKELNKKYDITGKTQNAISTGIDKVKEIEKNHNVTERVSSAAQTTYESAKDFDTRYDVSGKTKRALSGGISMVQSAFNSAVDYDKKNDVTGQLSRTIGSSFDALFPAVKKK
eukprot:g2077.t1